MNITPHVEQLQRQLLSAAAAGGPATEEIAERLAGALDAAGRLAILEALSEAAGEITAELAPGSVDVRLRGRDVEFAVTKPPVAEAPAAPEAPAPTAAAPSVSEDADDASTTRTTIRLPEALKARAERVAEAEGLSLNQWFVRAVSTALEPPRRGAATSTSSSITGWVR